MWEYLYDANGRFWTWFFIGDGGVGDYLSDGVNYIWGLL